jgi:hypothetical protein
MDRAKESAGLVVRRRSLHNLPDGYSRVRETVSVGAVASST